MARSSLNTLHHCVFALTYHLVLVTKYRRRVLSQAMLAAFADQASERCAAWRGELLECNGEADHVHLLLSLPPTVAISVFVNALKTGTSRRIRSDFAAEVRKHYWRPVLWSRSYCVLSSGGAPLSILKAYIQNQGKEG
jgi:putative transposase